MKASVQATLKHHIHVTPQLKESLLLLQLSSPEMQQAIMQKIEVNPMLEIANPDYEDSSGDTSGFSEENWDDLQWSHLYTIQQNTTPLQFNENPYPYQTLHCTPSLRDHLTWQMHLTPMTNVDQWIAATLIDAIDDNGFLTETLSELYQPILTELPELNRDDCEVVRHRLMRFDPVGCAATNLSETLLVQLEQLPATPLRTITKRIIQESLPLLARHEYQALMNQYQLNDPTLIEILNIIQHLNPNPGNEIPMPSSEFISPDLIAHSHNGRWKVSLNPMLLPKLSINAYYASLVNHASNIKDQQFMRDQLNDARWFIKNIQNRQETLLKVAQFIVQFQQAFFEFGEKNMKPLVLNDVAVALKLHPSTISRVTTQKYIHTPRGLFELKYFFTRPVHMPSGDQSSLSIQAQLKELVAKEDKTMPLTDSTLTRILAEKGLIIARRTVSKYRKQLNIQSSQDRNH